MFICGWRVLAPSSRRPEDLEVLAAQLNELGSGALTPNPNANSNRASQRISHLTQALDSDSDDSDGEIQQVNLFAWEDLIIQIGLFHTIIETVQR